VHDGFIPSLRQDGAKAVHLTPSIKYAAHPRCSSVAVVNGKYIQVILECRVWNSSLTALNGETMQVGDKYRIDENYADNSGMEFLFKSDKARVTTSDGIVVTGIMMRTLSFDPLSRVDNAWWTCWKDADYLRKYHYHHFHRHEHYSWTGKWTMTMEASYPVNLPQTAKPSFSVLARWGTGDRSCCDASAAFAVQGSFTYMDAELIPGSLISGIASRYDESIEAERKREKSTSETIDRLWFDELVLQATHELLAMLIEIASEIARGNSQEDVMCTQATDAVRNVKAIAFESLEVRAAARESVAVYGGLAGLRQGLAVRLNEVEKKVLSLVSKGAEEVRKSAKNMLDSVLEDFKEIGCVKEAKSEILEQQMDDLRELKLKKSGLQDTVLQLAQANPESKSLQKGAEQIARQSPPQCQ